MNAETASSAQHKRLARRVPGVSLTLFLVAIVVFLCPRLTSLLQYDRAAVLDGEFWRVLTCQWTHWNFSHVLWDALMFVTLGALCERLCRTTFIACVAASAVLIPIVSAAALPVMHHYRGLSGLDSAMFVLLAVQLIRLNRSRDRRLATAAALGLGAFVLKTVYECVTGSIIFVQPESVFTPIPLAHIVGGAIGLIIASQGGSHEHRNPLPAARSDPTHPSPDRDLCLKCSARQGI
jgi:rhomboid family GlyGly-CTERM serine protease